MAALHPAPDDPDLPSNTGTLLMLGPDEPAFWPAVTASPEWRDGAPDPMDRWSLRVIGDWAAELGVLPLFPFGGPPFRPFVRWALASGWVHSSPVRLLVHAEAGLWLSFRGALALPERIDLPAPPASPCPVCLDRPCLTACPVSALGAGGYDVPACRSFLRAEGRGTCMKRGCEVRKACPAGRDHGRVSAHSAWHMGHFIQ